MSNHLSGISGTAPLMPTASWKASAAKVAELMLAQGAVYTFPLLFAVVCARVLGPTNYGILSFYTALTAFLGMFIEFGFDSIGVREVHRAAGGVQPDQVLWNITLAKMLIASLTCAVAIPVLLMTRSNSEASLSFAMLAYLLAFAMDTAWYLRSLELTRSVLLVSAVSRLAGIVLLICLVRHHDDLGRAMWSYTFVAWANAVVMWVVMFRLRIVHRPRIEVPYLRSLLRSGASIVVGNLSGSALTNGGIALLGTIADPVLIGAANLAVRIKSAGLAVLTPLSQFGFVRLSRLAGAHPSAAVVLGRRMFYALISLGSLVSALILLNADLIARVAYGLPHPPPAAHMMLGLISAGIPLSLTGNLLCLQCLTLFKREGAYVCILLMAAAIFFGSMLLSPASNRAVAFGCGMLAAEAWVVLAAGVLIRNTVRDQ